MTILAINAANGFSTGNIMLGIAEVAREKGCCSYTASKYTKKADELERKHQNPCHFLIGYRLENTIARYLAWYTDLQDVGPKIGTHQLIKRIKKIQPDIIHLHDIVGWYIDIGMFFSFLRKYNIPIIWTMHCCWAYTGRCIYYDFAHCEQWKVECKRCPQINSYPYSKVFDRCTWNYKRKRKLFTAIPNLTIVTPSEWLKSEIQQSYLGKYTIKVINNGIDLSVFYPHNSLFREKHNLNEKKMVLFVASAWSKRKGLKDVFKLSELLPGDYKIVIVGLNKEQIKCAPKTVLALGITKSADELAEIYSVADVFVNPTYEDNYPTVNLEAQACGIPVITYHTGGSPESVDLRFGRIVEKGDIENLKMCIEEVCNYPDNKYRRDQLTERARCLFSRNARFEEYVELYRHLVTE